MTNPWAARCVMLVHCAPTLGAKDALVPSPKGSAGILFSCRRGGRRRKRPHASHSAPPPPPHAHAPPSPSGPFPFALKQTKNIVKTNELFVLICLILPARRPGAVGGGDHRPPGAAAGRLCGAGHLPSGRRGGSQRRARRSYRQGKLGLRLWLPGGRRAEGPRLNLWCLPAPRFLAGCLGSPGAPLAQH